MPNVLVNGSLGEVIGFSTTAEVRDSGSAIIGVPCALRELSTVDPGYAYQYDEEELEEWLENTRTWPIVRFRRGYSKTESVNILCIPHRFVALNPGGAVYAEREQVHLKAFRPLRYMLTYRCRRCHSRWRMPSPSTRHRVRLLNVYEWI